MENYILPAFPILETDTTRPVSLGLTKREYFAGKAMAAQIHSVSTADRAWDRSMEEIAENSIRMADALLKQLESK